MNLLNDLMSAFSHRVRPVTLCERERLEEIKTVEIFVQALLEKLDVALIQEHYDAIFWLTPEAFCYFLPRLIELTIKENVTELLAVDAIISMLDRSPRKEYWDDFFLSRWALLTPTECESLQKWILWLLVDGNCEGREKLDRAFDTLELLKSN